MLNVDVLFLKHHELVAAEEKEQNHGKGRQANGNDSRTSCGDHAYITPTLKTTVGTVRKREEALLKGAHKLERLSKASNVKVMESCKPFRHRKAGKTW